MEKEKLLPHINFTEFVLLIMFYARKHGVESFPHFNDKTWHLFLYKIKTEIDVNSAIINCLNGFVDNGQGPISRNLKDYGEIYNVNVKYDRDGLRILAKNTKHKKLKILKRQLKKDLEKIFEIGKIIPNFYEYKKCWRERIFNVIRKT